MKKSIIISIKPKWVEKILNGKKTIEIRKSIPKCELPIDVYIYVTKSEPYLRIYPFNIKKNIYQLSSDNFNCLNGKIVAKFTLSNIERFDVPYPAWFYEVKDKLQHITDGSCLTLLSLHHYLKNDSGFAWHIENLQIFGKPMELSDFYRNVDDFVDARPCNCGKKCKYESYDLQEYQSICGIDYDGESCPFVKIQKAPQSWCYCYKEKE